ncbi:MAG TPA: patatin-like phospholipase family protein, partial [Bacteroidia bacterium]|nr:patatin-like phospholipase family protein [Bacteroidia bacterium]
MKKKKIALALQGGGAHGAFTWGILEKLLEENALNIRGLCGTSVGAITAALAVYGIQKNGPKGALDLLQKFWKELSIATVFSMPQPTWMDNQLFHGNLDYSPQYRFFNGFTNYLAPSQFNPLNINPLRDIVGRLIDFEELKQSRIKLFVSATRVRDGSCKVFSLPDVSLDAVMASACLPSLSKAAEVKGEFYWDGGYTGNPPIYPLIHGTDAKDILLVQINPIKTDRIPQSVSEITDRVNEISFNANLMAEMRMINKGYDMNGKLNDTRFHIIPADKWLHDLNFSSTLNISWEFLNRLRMRGREAASEWLEHDLDRVGKESSPLLTEFFGETESSWEHEMIH